MKHVRNGLPALCLGCFCAVQSLSAAAEELATGIHIHTIYSTGRYSPRTVAANAAGAGLDAVILTDSALRRWEYGLPPFRKIFKRVVEERSVLLFGPQAYLDAVRAADEAEDGVVVVPGVEAAPFYYWERSPLNKDGGVIRAWQRHMLIFGLEGDELEALPLKNSPYEGDLGAVPHQRLIDAVNAAGGLVFWSHPASRHEGRHGSIVDRTEAYGHLLRETRGYDGFALTYWGYLDYAEPGQLWDALLSEYLDGNRNNPPWLIAELDLVAQSRPMRQALTHLKVENRTETGILDALRHGRAWVQFQKRAEPPIHLKHFNLKLVASERQYTSGETAPGTEFLVSVDVLSEAEGASVRVRLVHNGEVALDRSCELQRCIEAVRLKAARDKGYVRLIAEHSGGILFTNPIFYESERTE